QIGPLTRTARDAAVTLAVLAGHDAADATSAEEPVPDYVGALTGDIRGVRIGIPARLVDSGVDPEVDRAWRSALTILCDRGATISAPSMLSTSSPCRRARSHLSRSASACPIRSRCTSRTCSP